MNTLTTPVLLPVAAAVTLVSIFGISSAKADQQDVFRGVRNKKHLGKWLRRQPTAPLFSDKPALTGPGITGNFIEGVCGEQVVYLTRLPIPEEAGKAAWSQVLEVIHPGSQINSSQSKSSPSKLVTSEEWNSIPPKALELHNSFPCIEISRTTLMTLFCVMNARLIYSDVSDMTQSALRSVDRIKSSLPKPLDRTHLQTLLQLEQFLLAIEQSPPQLSHIEELSVSLTNLKKIPLETFDLENLVKDVNRLRIFLSAGRRAEYPCYSGLWIVEWPIGKPAHVSFYKHDLSPAYKDKHPPTFPQRVDKCLQMLAGVIEYESEDVSFKCAFPGRKASGKYVLRYEKNGFGGAHSGGHLYKMCGGVVSEVDYLRIAEPSTSESREHQVTLMLPSEENPKKKGVTLYVGEQEAQVLNEALDCLPWTNLSWSIHRGLRDVLVAFGKERMDQYRNRLAETLYSTVKEHSAELEASGWDKQFVQTYMADAAVSAVMSGGGNSGDTVRIVTAIAAVLQDNKTANLDQTHFWRLTTSQSPDTLPLDPMTVIALVKFFVLEWSNEFDYQMYHELPPKLYLG